MSIIYRLFCFFYFINYVRAIKEHEKCKVSIPYQNRAYEFSCLGLTSLNEHLEKAPQNTSYLSIVNSQISIIPRYSFSKFGATLEILDLRQSGISSIDVFGFMGLDRLKKLILSENNLTWIYGEWFRSLTNLQHLDISFNQIVGIDIVFYQLLPNLENFYFDYNRIETIDYNMFPLLGHLKKVKLGKNPWYWGYRVLLTQQLDNQRVDYLDDWEEWGWMSSVVRDCQDSGQASTLDDTVLNCAVSKLLRMEVEKDNFISDTDMKKMNSNICVNEAETFLQCSMQVSSSRDTLRKTFESLISVLKFTNEPNGKLYSKMFE